MPKRKIFMLKPSSSAVSAQSPEYTELRNFVHDLFAAWSTNTGQVNYDAIGRFYAKEPENVFYVPMPPLEGYKGWHNFRNGIEKNLFSSISKFHLTANEDLQLWRRGDLVWGTFTFNFSKTSKNGQVLEFEARMTAIFEQRNRQWLLVHEHASAPLYS